MQFKGPVTGTLSLAMPEEACDELAVNILGADDEDAVTPAQADDALKELLNVTCGQLLTEWAGTQPVFDLSVPEVTIWNPEEWDARMGNPEIFAFLVDGSPMLLQLHVDSEINSVE